MNLLALIFISLFFFTIVTLKRFDCNAMEQYLEDEVTVGLVLILELPGRLVSHGGCLSVLSEIPEFLIHCK